MNDLPCYEDVGDEETEQLPAEYRPGVQVGQDEPFDGLGEKIHRTLGRSGPVGTDVTDRDWTMADEDLQRHVSEK